MLGWEFFALPLGFDCSDEEVVHCDIVGMAGREVQDEFHGGVVRRLDDCLYVHGECDRGGAPCAVLC